jgi:hypothetical protein
VTQLLYVHYGCGVCAAEGWRNFDASPRLRIERLPVLGGTIRAFGKAVFPSSVRYGDIVHGLAVGDGTAAAVYCSHVLEHLSREDVSIALRNSLRMLTPGGIFRMVVPDLHWRAVRYVAATAENLNDGRAADIFLESTMLGEHTRARTLPALARQWLGNSRHLWMYDFYSMRQHLEDAGFEDVRRSNYGDWSDPMFSRVESRDRFEDDGYPELAIQCKRPGGLNLNRNALAFLRLASIRLMLRKLCLSS